MPVLLFLYSSEKRAIPSAARNLSSPEAREIPHFADPVRNDGACCVKHFWVSSAATLGAANEIFQTLADVGIFEEITFLGGGHTLCHLAQKPLVVIGQPLECFANEGFHIPALLSGNAVQLSLQFRRNLEFHRASLE